MSCNDRKNNLCVLLGEKINAILEESSELIKASELKIEDFDNTNADIYYKSAKSIFFNQEKYDLPYKYVYNNDFNNFEPIYPSELIKPGVKEFCNKNEELALKTLKKINNLENSLSVCLFKKDSFLFMGDLESDIIPYFLDEFKNIHPEYGSKEVYVKFLHTPHHGTHTNLLLCDAIKCDWAISSLGSRMNRFYKSDFWKKLSEWTHSTYENRDFDKEF